MIGRKWLMATMLIAVFLIAGFPMFMPRAGRISALTSYWTPYPTHPPFTWSSPSLWPPVVDGDTESQPPSNQEVEAEEYAVYSAYIAQSLYRKWERIRIRDRTTHTASGSQNATIEYLTERMPEIVKDTIDDFFDRNQKSYPLGNYFDIDMPYELVNSTVPYEVLEFSRVGFNPSMTQALFEAGYMNGPAMGYGSYVLMIKENGVWSIQGGACAWIS